MQLSRRDALTLMSLTLAKRASADPASDDLTSLDAWLRADPKARQQALQRSLDRIRRMDPSIHAWVQVQPQPQTGHGPLAGIPLGVKDIIETKNLVTEYGSPVYKGRLGSGDAPIVTRFKELGAIVVGKTQAAAFAYRTPPPTRNPRNLAHTPGGSSSGSAAAVAAGMVPITIGTQTMGSILRPASYCGVTGFKPTFGTLPTEGVMELAHTLDTVGLFTNTPADMLQLWSILGKATGKKEELVFGAVDPLPELVEAPMATAFRQTVARLRSQGLKIQPVPLAPLLVKLIEEATVVEFYEGARFHRQRYAEFGDRLLDVADLVRKGLQISEQRYAEALAFIKKSQEQIAGTFQSTPVILSPAATGPAPDGLTNTGDHSMNTPWTALRTPAISIPMPVGSALPLGLQLTAAQGEDARVLNAAAALARMLD